MRPFKLLPLLLLLATAAFAANWAGEVTTPTTTETIDGKKFYVITNAAELAGFAAMVNAGDTAANAVLDNDIVVNEGEVTTSSQKWTPIGYAMYSPAYMGQLCGEYAECRAFSGTFDGKGYSVSGIYANTSFSFSGLFGYVGEHGIVKNLTLKKSLIFSFSGAGIVGLNAGALYDLTSSENKDSVSFNGSSAGDYTGAVGGVAGRNSGVIANCVNVNSFVFSGGEHGSAGGISGINRGGVITNCVNEGVVSVTGYAVTGYNGDGGGGIVGRNGGMVSACINKGMVAGAATVIGGISGFNFGTIEKCSNEGSLESKTIAGGLTGANFSPGTIKNSFSFVDSLNINNIPSDGFTCLSYFYSGSAVGGLIGTAEYGGLLQNAYSVTLKMNVEGCYATSVSAGGLIGYDSLKVQMAYYNSAVTGVTSAVGVDSSKVAPEYMGSLTTAQMQTDEFAWWLNTTHGDSANSGVWSRGKGYPVFADSVHLATHRVVFISGGVTLSTVYSDSTGTIACPSNPASSSGSFIGWIYDTTSILETGSKITRDIVASPLFATAAPVKVTFQDADGTAIVSRFVNKDGTVLLPADPAAASGTFFVGWFKADESQLTATSVITANTTVHAVYKDISEGYLIVFKNYDGTVLDSHYVLTNVFPAYKGAAPVKAATARCTYKFNGWTPAIAAATAGATYTAVFDSTVNRYRIVFLQAAGDTLQKDSVAYGETPVYSGTTPVKASTATYEYTFSTWSPAVSSVTGDATYTASFDRSAVGETVTYTITFKNYNGTTLSTQTVLKDATPVYNGAPPVKTATARYTYKFNAWTPAIAAATANASYTAVFDSTVNRYRIVFLQAAGDTLQKDSVAYGETPVYSGTTPVKASSEDYDYVFDGWDPALANVTGDATYTAYFNRTSKGTTSALLRSPAVFSFSVEGGILRVENAAMNTPYALMDVQGRVLARGLIQSSVQNIALPGAGSYLVKVGTDSRLVRVRQ